MDIEDNKSCDTKYHYLNNIDVDETNACQILVSEEQGGVNKELIEKANDVIAFNDHINSLFYEPKKEKLSMYNGPSFTTMREKKKKIKKHIKRENITRKNKKIKNHSSSSSSDNNDDINEKNKYTISIIYDHFLKDYNSKKFTNFLNNRSNQINNELHGEIDLFSLKEFKYTPNTNTNDDNDDDDDNNDDNNIENDLNHNTNDDDDVSMKLVEIPYKLRNIYAIWINYLKSNVNLNMKKSVKSFIQFDSKYKRGVECTCKNCPQCYVRFYNENITKYQYKFNNRLNIKKESEMETEEESDDEEEEEEEGEKYIPIKEYNDNSDNYNDLIENFNNLNITKKEDFDEIKQWIIDSKIKKESINDEWCDKVYNLNKDIITKSDLIVILKECKLINV